MQSRKRSKRKFRSFVLKIVFLALIIYLGIQGISFLTTSKEERALQELKYSNGAISLIIDNKIDKYLIDSNIYSKTLEVALVEGKYKSDLLKEYVSLPYKNYDSYITDINKLYTLGYKRADVQAIYEKLDKDDISIIVGKEVLVNNLSSYIDNQYFLMDNLDRYVNYKKENPSYDFNRIISSVNMYLDYPYYEHTISVKKPDDLLVLVNKYYTLDSTFVPKNLVKIDKEYVDEYDRFVIPVVKENFEKMASDMKKLGLIIKVNSAYRSYQQQVDTYNGYVNGRGKAYADSISARPGNSEHQTGLAVDVKDSTDDYGYFKDSQEYKWMTDNAHKYGFILRFPDKKTDVTGYSFEAWHFRYVGKDIAKYIYEHDLTLDEYYSMFIANKKD